MTRRHELDEVGGIEHGRDAVSRARMWQRMQEELERRDAEDAAMQTGGVAVPHQTQQPLFVEPVADEGSSEAQVGAIAGALGAGLKAILTESPTDKRLGMMAQMQAQALARLEAQVHAEQVQAGVRESEPVEGNAEIARSEQLRTRKHERDLQERELQKRLETQGYAEDYVEPSAAPSYQSARERLEDQKDREKRRLDR